MLPTTSPTFFDHLIIFFIAVILPAALGRSPQLRLEGEEGPIDWSTQTKLTLYRSNSLFMWGVTTVILVAWLMGGRTLGDIGFRLPDFSYSNWWLTLTGVFIALELVDATLETSSPKRREKTRKHLRENIPFLPKNNLEFKGFLLMVLSAAICEEIIFRGYFTTYMLAIAGTGMTSKIIAAVFPALIFGIIHLYQGWKSVGKIVVMGTLLGAIIILSQSLVIPILLHAFVDLVGGWVAMKLFTEKEFQAEGQTSQSQE